jgi:hypothetical protein
MLGLRASHQGERQEHCSTEGEDRAYVFHEHRRLEEEDGEVVERRKLRRACMRTVDRMRGRWNN